MFQWLYGVVNQPLTVFGKRTSDMPGHESHMNRIRVVGRAGKNLSHLIIN